MKINVVRIFVWIIIIHPICLIPEKIITMICLVMTVIIKDPINRLRNLIKAFVIINIVVNQRGASFCQVIIMNKPVVLSCLNTLGSQKWKGAAPSFIKRPIKINKHIVTFDSVTIDLLKIIIDPTLWTIKYIIAGFFLFSSFINVGTKFIRLSSKPSQTKGQELIDMAAIDPSNTPAAIYFNENKVY